MKQGLANGLRKADAIFGLRRRLTMILPGSGPAASGMGGFDRFVDAANRLPRPILAFGVIAVFLFAMVDPASFSRRMEALRTMPDEMWWILGALLAGHYGAREVHHLRQGTAKAGPDLQATPDAHHPRASDSPP